MRTREKTVGYRFFILLIGLLLLLVIETRAEQLPIRVYTTAEGLVSNKISRIVRDSRGFMWFCTEDGLSRFDGYRFTNYTTQQGLPINWVDDFLETREGVFLVATGAGLCLFDPQGVPLPQEKITDFANTRPMFSVYRPNVDERAATIKVLYEDPAGRIWCGTRRGLYRIEISNRQLTFRPIDLGIRSSDPEDHRIRGILADQAGTLWIASRNHIFRLFADGRTETLIGNGYLSIQNSMAITIDSQQHIWAGARSGLWQISQTSASTSSPVIKHFGVTDGIACAPLNAVFTGQDGRLWTGADCGVYEFLKGEKRFRKWLGSENLRDLRVWSFNEDRSGNLWIGTAHGAVQLAHNGFTTYTEADGLGFRDVHFISETHSGEIGVCTLLNSQTMFFDKFDGRRFVSRQVKPRPYGVSSFEYLRQLPFQDHQGEWWWPTLNGLYRFAKTARLEELFNTPPIAHYTVKDGLPVNYLVSAYEDKSGDLWIAIGGKTQIARWQRTSGKFQIFSEADGLPAGNFPVTMREDHAGNLWVGFVLGGIARYANGRFTSFTAADGLPSGEIRQLLSDSQGRLWVVGTESGLSKIENPSADILQITRYTTANGLASDTVLCLAEDRPNQFYVATNRGLNYINFDTGNVKRFTSSDGLANDQVNMIYRDRSGAFWFGTSTGVSRLLPQSPSAQTVPPIFINEIKVFGEVRRISEIGETAMSGLELAPNRNQLEIGFGSLTFAAGDLVQYQYKLEGANNDWQPLTTQRTVNYASLKPGDYRFLVRAINSDGLVSPTPATIEFRVLSPVWQRWWFLTLAALMLGLLIYTLIRYRVNRLLELERVRTRIAADLHDDIGANLTRIAILSEVANAQLSPGARALENPLSAIAHISRESVSSMSDIVWAINPRKDSLFDLIGRMRRLAEDLLPSRGIACNFQAPESEANIKLGSEIRRDLFLIFKEALNNAVRHSACQRININFRSERHQFVLILEDDGRGFAINESSDGHGLINMRRRAESLGGNLHIASTCGKGTTITLTIPR
ncbi:MAG: two-component regulator propeller domain-containing protein [Acidobacteriota bacterium]